MVGPVVAPAGPFTTSRSQPEISNGCVVGAPTPAPPLLKLELVRWVTLTVPDAARNVSAGVAVARACPDPTMIIPATAISAVAAPRIAHTAPATATREYRVARRCTYEMTGTGSAPFAGGLDASARPVFTSLACW